MQDSVFKMLELLRFTYHQSIKQTPFEKHFGRKPDTQLSVQFKNIREIFRKPERRDHLPTDRHLEQYIRPVQVQGQDPCKP